MFHVEHRKEKIMTVNDVITVISTLGFPIVMCGALFWYLVKNNEEHKNEVENLRKTLENNTIALTRLCDKLEG